MFRSLLGSNEHDPGSQGESGEGVAGMTMICITYLATTGILVYEKFFKPKKNQQIDDGDFIDEEKNIVDTDKETQDEWLVPSNDYSTFVKGCLCVGVLYDRVHSREISDYGGVANTMPVFAAFMVFFAMSNAGLPGTSGFVGEFMVILASFEANFWYAFLAATTLILGAAYTLWMVKRVLYGEVANTNVGELTDINNREFLVLMILAISVLIVGIWPAPLVEMMSVSIENLLLQISNSKLPGMN